MMQATSKLATAGVSRWSTLRGRCVRACLLGTTLAAALFASPAIAQQAAGDEHASSVAARYSPGSIRSPDDADAALAEVARERGAIDARYEADVQACYSRFFATSCIEEAKERRRRALSVLRPIEIEANTYKRQARVMERDKALADRKAKDERGREEKRNGAQDAGEPAASGRASPLHETGRGEIGEVESGLTSPPAKPHDAEPKRPQAIEADDAKKRAENVAAYERKVQAALARQQQVAARKAEKERKRKRRQAENSEGN